jgi:hypothetical protein
MQVASSGSNYIQQKSRFDGAPVELGLSRTKAIELSWHTTGAQFKTSLR